ncbi:Microtubule-associated serine/threonine-protein kinase 4 [Desmophyllum pertusum]|uniref:Microtubule-associated serine/threonine-protein kinase 4 n=1 Tax=Desmophyllum pertusum TaxID=174260 RepID=A0A9W9YJP6_9CNID|nr:Microtubule-associated serine/threonine-protein kinase 4 [Desmophyllum pertusum]
MDLPDGSPTVCRTESEGSTTSDDRESTIRAFLEKESLGHLTALFPEDVSLSYFQALTDDDLEHDYNVKDDKERELLMHSISKLRREEFSADESDSELDNSAELSEVFSSLPRGFKFNRSRFSDEFNGDGRAKRERGRASVFHRQGLMRVLICYA